MPASLFTITPTPPTSITVAPGETGTFSFTITCQAAPDRSYGVILQALLVGADGRTSEAEWLRVGPESTLRMTGGETATVVITARPTTTAPAGSNHLKLAVADKDQPNDTYTYSSPVVCEIRPRDGTAPSTTRKFPLWLIAAIVGGVVVLAGGGILIWKLMSSGGDTPVIVDAPPAPSDAAVDLHTVHVTTTGDDAKDGVTGPVKTLKRAVAIANGNGAITAIALTAGKYGAANGETFPYAVPANVTITGDPAGGTVLAGTGTGDGLTLDTGKLQDLELRDFGAAIKVTGTASLSNAKLHNNAIAVSVETAGKLTVAKLDLAGTAGACNIGLQVRGSGQLTVTGLTAQAVGTVLNQLDDSSVSITTANLVGDAACAKPVLAVDAASFTLTDVTIDGGDAGIGFSGRTAATLTNTTIANVKNNAITGRVKTAQITGGELRNNGRAGMEVFTGTWTLTNVGIKGNPVMGIYLQGSAAAPSTLVMRGCTVNGNGNGIYLFDFAVADLGTAASPGNNTIQNNVNIGLQIDGFGGPRTIDAAGNTWRPRVQGADAQGRYSATLVPGAVPEVDRNNFAINAGWRLQL